MVLQINEKEIIENLEANILIKLIHKNKEPRCVNNTYGQFINVGRIAMLEELGIIDSENAKKYMNMAKGKFSDDILKMYNNTEDEGELESLISLYDSLIGN